jgi:hypothetical protein
MSVQGFGTCSGEKYELSGNEIRQGGAISSMRLLRWALPKT